MPPDWLLLGAAFTSGLMGGAHCAAMCGGIAAGFSAAAARPGLSTALQANGGRIAGYVLAGALVGGLGDGLLSVARIDGLVVASRAAVGLVLVLAALRLLDAKGRLRALPRPAVGLWRRIQPLQRRLAPADSPVKRIALGMLWAWLPCGLSTTLLAAAWLQADAMRGAATMFAFGLGTLPLMVPLTWSGARLGRWLQRPSLRQLAGVCVLTAGVFTLAAPWLIAHPAMDGALKALGCGSAFASVG